MAADDFAVDLRDLDSDALEGAVNAVMDRQRAELRRGAQAVFGETDDSLAAEHFQSLLELGYLAASADGLDDTEREALAHLIGSATDDLATAAALQLHFRDLDATTELLGRHARLARVANNLGSETHRRDAVAFAALVAMADGRLEPAELEVLYELGGHLGLADDQIRDAVARVAAQVRKAAARTATK